MTYDVIVKNGLWFDGTGGKPFTRNLGIRNYIAALIAIFAADFVKRNMPKPPALSMAERAKAAEAAFTARRVAALQKAQQKQ